MNDLMQRLERDFLEQMAGTTKPDAIPAPPHSKDAELIRVWQDHEGAEL